MSIIKKKSGGAVSLPPSSAPASDQRLRLEYVPTEQLKPLPSHPRSHTRKHVNLLAASIQELGNVGPILIDEKKQIVCGVARWKAAKQLGLTEVPVLRASWMTPVQLRAFRIMDNRFVEKGGWDNGSLAKELEFLLEEGFDVELTGFDTGEIDALLGLGEPGEEAVELPSDDEPLISVSGDIWQIGGHRIACGDARDPEVYRRLFDGAVAQMVFTDPPYNVAVGGNVTGIRKKTVQREFAMASGEMSDAEFETFLKASIERMAAACQPGAIAYICIDWRHISVVLTVAAALGLDFKQLCVWAKTNAGMGSFYRSQHELVPVFKVPGAEHINNFALGRAGRNRTNVWSHAGANGFRKGRAEDLASHPTVKPTALVADAILDCSKRGGIIFDAFLGSGTTAVAAERTGRRCYGIEIDPAYVDVALRRLEQETGHEPVLESGETFAEVAAMRLKKEAA